MYEYQIAWKNHQICNEQPYLNEMAKKGWRLITAIHTSMSPTIKYYWERKIPGTTGLDITPRCPPRR